MNISDKYDSVITPGFTCGSFVEDLETPTVIHSEKGTIHWLCKVCVSVSVLMYESVCSHCVSLCMSVSRSSQ